MGNNATAPELESATAPKLVAGSSKFMETWFSRKGSTEGMMRGTTNETADMTFIPQ